MGRYRKRPVVVEAVQWTGENQAEIAGFVPKHELYWSEDHQPCILTREGTMRANVGDWIIRGVAREFYPCKPDIFDATYEREEE